MSKKTKAVKTEPVSTPQKAAVVEPILEAVPAVVEPITNAVAIKVEAQEEIKERLVDAAEALESFDDIKLPIVRLTNDGFEMSEGAEPIHEFTGVIVFTKQSNVYYKKKYKPGVVEMPDCVSANGREPDSSVESPVSKACKGCPMNEYGSARDGEGKACKNTRPTFILVDNPESDMLSVMPKVLRISPTSLGLARNFFTNIAADFGSYFAVRTKFSCFKKDEGQIYFNVKMGVNGRLKPQEKANVKAVRSQWLTYMQTGLFGVDEVDVTPEASTTTEAPAMDETQGEVDF